jgi:hypothetical protein
MHNMFLVKYVSYLANIYFDHIVVLTVSLLENGLLDLKNVVVCTGLKLSTT